MGSQSSKAPGDYVTTEEAAASEPNE
ncbi:hypothetical protein J1605_012410 [Eschrichtius robustus]|uniref:Uncharacterized protein n=1 Tax=Eschrichtius robustus TaxID=9764 RepID=A0AB34GL52_ESCRO|nr:hypothetical protein J1605_012410 [Eschrichtius robustus]